MNTNRSRLVAAIFVGWLLLLALVLVAAPRLGGGLFACHPAITDPLRCGVDGLWREVINRLVAIWTPLLVVTAGYLGLLFVVMATGRRREETGADRTDKRNVSDG